jgi:hypothetical protein
MKASLPLAVIPSIALLCGLSGTAMSQIATGTTSPLPAITVQAPKQVARPHRAKRMARSYRPRGNEVASRRTSPTTQTPSAAQDSILAKLAKLEKASGSCVGGCQTSFPSGNRPWVGCSGSGWPALSSTCRNVGNYKTYIECTETSYFLAWKPMEVHWYCTSLALK